MKKLIKISTVLVLILALTFTLGACADKVAKESAWKTAVYDRDTELGEGSKTLTVTVEAEGQKIVFTIHSDAETVCAAMEEHDLVDGEEAQYGLYVKAINGIVADYDTDQTYWAFNKDGEYMMTGIDQTTFADGDSYELVKTKG